MRLSYRFFLPFFSLIVAAVAVFFISLAAGWEPPLSALYEFLAIPSNRWAIGVASFAVLLVSLYLFLTSFQKSSEREVVLRETEHGYVEITNSALEDLIRRAARHVRGIREVKPILRHNKEGLSVILRVGVNPDATIPAVSEQVQQITRDYLEEKAGIQVRGISVLVESVSFEQKARVE
ncbi:MAG: Alkaline shock protein 24 [Thermacetogenium phaeum]|uniref:Alkaline shock protein 24 n=1 Tax=Thermacetogenium phaeum TaxID=85874 RepID=A0A101FGA1_9THEO|nr:MAG: Alkaline shock protein 24 [Thermacetogenium phaeum]